DVERIRYGIPGEPSSEYLEVQAYASRGCPMNCNFCVCRHLYYHKSNWRPRNPDNVVAEMHYLKNKYPHMEGIFFDEECHNIKKKFVVDLCKAIVQNNLHNLKIEAMCAYATLDEEMMRAMKEAGYYLLRVGIETAGEGAAAGIGLGAKFNLEKLRKTLHVAKKIGLKMYGTFTFGAPGSSQKDDQATLHLMDEIIGDGLLWKFQTSICTPQPGTPFYKWAVEKNLLKTYVPQEYDGGNRVVVEYPDYSSEEIMKTYLSSQKYFDLALKNRFSLKIDESIKVLQQFSLQKILVLRTSRMPQVEVALRALKRMIPHCVIDVLGQPAVYGELMQLEKEAVIDTIYLYDKGFFSQKELSEELCDTIRTQKYDIACIVYSNVKGQGFENVEAFLQKLHIEKWIAFNADGDILKQTDMRKIRNAKYVSCAP
ncbi:MAG: radical SAM protein, partial [Candidatus Omnitrophica bacterium]|nr:radical SAM protein [Candidatus Omnitrophota bacterium]